jgi:phage minor structural protein
MIKLFGINDTIFSSNGDKIILPMKAKVHKEDNGSFYLDLETDLSYVDDLTQNRIIVANTPQGNQAFRIGNVEKTKTRLKTKCYHVYYDSLNYLIADSNVVEKNCNDALDHLNMATDNFSVFTTLSDVTTVSSFRCVRKSLYEAINTVLERWGGHLVRNNFNIEIRNSIGQDNGVTVRYKKNLQEITCSENWDSVVTKLLPVGKDELMLDEMYLYSNVTYDVPYTKTVSFNQDNVNEDDYKDENDVLDEVAYNQALIDDLRSKANAYLEINCIPKVNYTLKANLEKVSDVGDTINVIDERLGISIVTNVISYDYDCILEEYKQLEFGNFKQKLENLVSNIENTVNNNISEKTNEVKVALSNELQSANEQIWNAMNNSYVIYDGDKILVVDELPKENATNVIMINNGGIAFSQNGINGAFNSAWTIDGTMDMQKINVINLVADMIKGGTLKLGSNLNQSGILEIYNESNTLIGEMNKNGLKMYGLDGSYVLLNNEVGFSGYDADGSRVFWADKDEFHMKKSVIEEEITIANNIRAIPITSYDTDGINILGDGLGFVAVYKDISSAEDRIIIADVTDGRTTGNIPSEEVSRYNSFVLDVTINANYNFSNHIPQFTMTYDLLLDGDYYNSYNVSAVIYDSSSMTTDSSKEQTVYSKTYYIYYETPGPTSANSYLLTSVSGMVNNENIGEYPIEFTYILRTI